MRLERDTTGIRLFVLVLSLMLLVADNVTLALFADTLAPGSSLERKEAGDRDDQPVSPTIDSKPQRFQLAFEIRYLDAVRARLIGLSGAALHKKANDIAGLSVVLADDGYTYYLRGRDYLYNLLNGQVIYCCDDEGKSTFEHLLAVKPAKSHWGRRLDVYTYPLPDRTEGVEIIVPRFTREDLWRDPIWWTRREIAGHFSGKGISVPHVIILNQLQLKVLGKESASTDEDVLYLSLDQSVSKMISETQQYIGGKVYEPSINPITSPNYSHVALFSHLYAEEIKTMREMIDMNAAVSRRISILELGSSLGEGSFVLGTFLGPKKVFLVAVDIREDLLAVSQRYANSHGLKNFFFRKIDVSTPPSTWRKEIAELTNGSDKFTYVIANHVLEHLEGKSPVERALEWLELASEGLVISVPFEPEDLDISDHHIRFNENSLIRFAQTVVLQSTEPIGVDLRSVKSGLITFTKQPRLTATLPEVRRYGPKEIEGFIAGVDSL